MAGITALGARHAAVLANVSKSAHQIARPLMTADEVMRLRAPVKDAVGNTTKPGNILIFAVRPSLPPLPNISRTCLLHLGFGMCIRMCMGIRMCIGKGKCMCMCRGTYNPP